MCIVCGSLDTESHFGGTSCRACAAFFRRFYHSKKLKHICTCQRRDSNSHPCRSCRFQKCLQAGMSSDRVQITREKHGSKRNSPSLDLTHLPSKDLTNITSSIQNFSIFEFKRSQLFQKLDHRHVSATTSLAKNEVQLTLELVQVVFPSFEKMTKNDKSALINSFVIKIWQLEPILDHLARRIEYRKLEEIDIRNMMITFFEGSFVKGAEMSEEEIWRKFSPHWIYFFQRVIDPIIALKLDQIEMLAVVWILFFDYANINISHKSTDLCWEIRKVIHQELKNYIFEKIKDEESAEIRFLEVLEVPLIIERAEQRFQEEVLIYELNMIQMHEDFETIVKRQRI